MSVNTSVIKNDMTYDVKLPTIGIGIDARTACWCNNTLKQYPQISIDKDVISKDI